MSVKSVSSWNDDRYFYLIDRVYINAESAMAPELITKCPQVPAVNRTALELISELIHEKVTAEAKVGLLKKAIQNL
jgi:hypothetical protein